MANSSSDDGVGGFILLIVGGFSIWWLYDNYEVVERKDEENATAENNLDHDIALRPSTPYTVTITTSGTAYKIDPATITGDRSNRRAWVIMDHSKDKSKSSRETRELIWTNCQTGEVKTLSRVTYDPKGNVTDINDTSFEDAKVAYFPPDTVGAAAPKEMCKSLFDERP